MKYFFTLILYFHLILIKSQTGFDVIYEADYKVTYKDQNIINAIAQEASYALLINEKESYYKNMNKYIGDSLRYEKKLTDNSPLNEQMKYLADYPENIGTTSGKFYVTIQTIFKKFKYEESNTISWQLINEFKIIGKYKCQKAISKKYGRTWTAWFTKDIPFPFGPYKFNKLPGLILEVYDEKKDYIFSMYSFRKRKYFCKSANMDVKAIFVEKSKVFDYQRKEIGDPNVLGKFLEDSEQRQEINKKGQERAKNYNPIELKID